MNAIKPAFANVHNFLHFIVLPNCIEYFDAQEQNPNDSTRRDEHRHLFNAVVGLDSAVDHSFNAKPRSISFEQYRDDLIAREPILGKLREVANALKHCVTRDKPAKPKPDATDLSKLTINVHVDVSSVGTSVTKVDLTTEFLLDAKRTVEEAFRFWLTYAQKLDTDGPA
jgi:hypothetical protein